MTERLTEGEVIGRALAYSFGDLRDWPWACAVCGSERVVQVLDHRDVWRCGDCLAEITGEVMYEARNERAKADVFGVSRPFFPTKSPGRWGGGSA